MDRATIKSSIISQLSGDPYVVGTGPGSPGDTDMNLFINEALDIIGRKTPLMNDSVSINTVLNQAEYELPTNIAQVKSVTWDGHSLSPISFMERNRQMDGIVVSVSSGFPYQYYIRRKTNSNVISTGGTDPLTSLLPSPLLIGLLPSPGSVKVLSIECSLYLGHLSIDQDIPQFTPQFHDMIVDYVLSKLWFKKKEYSLCQSAKDDFREKLNDYGLYIQQTSSGEEIPQRVDDISWGL